MKPGDLVKVRLPEGKPNILCWVVPSIYYNGEAWKNLKRIPDGALGLLLHTVWEEIDSMRNKRSREVVLIDEELISIPYGYLKEVKSE